MKQFNKNVLTIWLKNTK